MLPVAMPEGVGQRRSLTAMQWLQPPAQDRHPAGPKKHPHAAGNN